jgi:hypothetical protein
MVTLLVPSTAAADRATVLKSCDAQLNLAEKICGCIADKAAAEFNEKQYAFFLAVITQDKAAQAQLQSQMNSNELVQVGLRMGQMPAECAG